MRTLDETEREGVEVVVMGLLPVSTVCVPISVTVKNQE